MPRRYTDDELRSAVSSSQCWADVMERIGKQRKADTSYVRRSCVRLGLDVTHLMVTRLDEPHPKVASPFTTRRRTAKGSNGVSRAIGWFLKNGYNVAIPVEVASYDLIAESDDGLKKVQVKTTKTRTREGRYQVRLTRTIYDAAQVSNSRGKYRPVPYGPGDIDYFFICAGTDQLYVIPYEVVAHVISSIVLDVKYQNFAVK